MIFWIIIALGVIIGASIGFYRFDKAAQQFDTKGYRQRTYSRDYDRPKWWQYVPWEVMWVTVLSICAAFLACFIISEAVDVEPTHHNVERASILTLNDHSDTETHADGWFVLGIGGYSSDEEVSMKYSFWQETKDESFFRHTVMPDYNTTVRIHFLEDGEQPYFQRVDPADIYDTPSWIAPMDLKQDEHTHTEVVTLFVPKGTIKYQNVYEIDEK